MTGSARSQTSYAVLPEFFSDLHPDQWTLPYWEAAREHRLVAAKCASCGTFRTPPAPFCPGCRSQDIEWAELPGTGTIFSFTTIRHAVVEDMRPYVPYSIAVVDLDEAPGGRYLGVLVETDLDTVAIGQRVEVVWDDIHENLTIPRYRVVG